MISLLIRHDDANKAFSCNRIALIDVLTLLLLACLTISSLINDTIESPGFYRVMKWGLIFFILRISLSTFSKVTKTTILFIVASYFLSELFLGWKQIITGTYSHNPELFCSGSFLNSGPYGGFISVGICMLLAYLLLSDSIGDKHRKFLIIATLPAMIILVLSMSRAAIVSFLISMSFLLLKHKRQWFIKHQFILLPLLIVLLIFMYFYKKPSADARYYINSINIEAIKQKPLWGNGFNSFGKVYGNKQREHFVDALLDKEKSIDKKISDTDIVHKLIEGNLSFSDTIEKDREKADVPDVAFNEYYQVAIEHGIIVALLFVIIIIISIIRLYKNDSPWAYALISLSCFALFSYPFSYIQFKLLLLFGVAHASTICYPEKRNNKVVSTAILVVLLIAVYFIHPLTNTDLSSKKKWEREVKQLYWLGDYDSYVIESGPLFKDLGYNTEFLYMYGNALKQAGDLNQSDSVFTIGASLSNHPKFNTALGLIKQQNNDFGSAEECYCRAYLMVPNRLYPLYLLAKLYYETGNYDYYKHIVRYIEKYPPKLENKDTYTMRKEIEEMNSLITD